MDISEEYDKYLSTFKSLNVSIEEAMVVQNDLSFKQQLLQNRDYSIVKQAIVNSKTGLAEISLEDIEIEPYFSLTVSIESDKSLLRRIYDSIKQFFINLYKKIKKIVKWFGRLIGVLDDELEDIRKDINGKKGVLIYKDAKHLRPEDMKILFNAMKVQYFLHTTIDFGKTINIIADMKNLDVFIKDLGKLIKGKNGLSIDLLNGNLSSLNAYPKTKIDTEVLIQRCIPLNGSVKVYPKGNLNSPHYAYYVPLSIGGDMVRAIVSLEEDKKIILWKGRVTDKEFSETAEVIPFENIKTLIQAVKSMDSTGFVSKVNRLLEVSNGVVNKTIVELEKNIDSGKGDETNKKALQRMRDVGTVVTQLPIELISGYNETKKGIQTYIKVMDDQYI